MELVIPDGAQVHITVGAPSALALTYDQAPAVPRRFRPVLTGIVVSVLMLGSYEFGKRVASPSSDRVAQSDTRGGPSLARAANAETRSAGVESLLPAISAPQSQNDPGRIPAEFTQQLRQTPTVTLPPGQPGPVGSANPFGLHP